ncbi:MAG: NAD-dependent DNA ligase LigA [Cytophagales bacterium]
MQNSKSRIDYLTDKLHYYNQQYYLNNTSEITDFEFDNLLKELHELELKYPEFKHINSPTERVGGGLTKEFETVFHKYSMLSLSNTYNENELNDFSERIRKNLIDEPFEFVCEQKFDGVAISLWYENGKLIRALTRGDGEKGDDVINNIKTIKTIPLVIQSTENLPRTFEVRGEVFLPRKNFENINIKLAQEGKPTLANPRNAASGTVKMQDSKVVSQRGLDCYIYSFLCDEPIVNSHSESLIILQKWGFQISPTWKITKNIAEVLDYIHFWEQDRKKLPLDTDGVVIKINSFLQQQKLGMTAKSPRWATAYKYKPENASTRLKSITYQVGRTGAITPVAELEEVELSGTKVRRASLHNADEIERLGLHLDDYVFVEKGGEIIPKVTAVDLSKRNANSSVIQYITKCPECGTELVRKPNEAVHYCPNEKGCKPQILGKFEHFVSRNALNIDSVGSKTIEQLYNAGLISQLTDLYVLQKEQLLTLEGFKEKSVENILIGIENSKSIPFHKVLFGLGIRYVGETVAEKLVFQFNTIDNMINATFEDFQNTPEIGDKIAASLVEYFNNESNLNVIHQLKSFGVKFEAEQNQMEIVDKLNGQTFVISGVFKNYERDELKGIIIKNGGKVLSGVSGKLNYLVAGEGMGPSKLQKAIDLGVQILSEEEFENMIK